MALFKTETPLEARQSRKEVVEEIAANGANFFPKWFIFHGALSFDFLFIRSVRINEKVELNQFQGVIQNPYQRVIAVCVHIAEDPRPRGPLTNIPSEYLTDSFSVRSLQELIRKIEPYNKD